MKELKVFLVVVVLTAITYWGVEPLAHSVMHPHVAPASYDFAKEDIDLAKSNLIASEKSLENAKKSGNKDAINNSTKEVENNKANLSLYTEFWNQISAIDLVKGNVTNGKNVVEAAGCLGCHSIEKAGFPAAMDAMTASESFGVAPPDLSNIGYLYDAKFLAALIVDPVKALKLSHKFGDENPFPMPAFAGAGGDDMNQEIADMIAYFKSIAPKTMNPKDVFVESCARCHDMKYDKIYTNGNKQSIAKYLGSTPPDLSMMIRSRSVDYLHNFINDTQKMLPGTSMPRVGLTKVAEDQVVAYMEKVGDSKKAERETFGYYAMLYFLILGIFATLWKRKIWSKLH